MDNLFIWQRPQKNHHYSIGFDPAGAGTDASCAEVLCYETREYAAEYHDTGVLEPDAARALRKLGLMYNQALLVPEIAVGYGTYTVEYLIEEAYPRLYHRHKERQFGKSPMHTIGWKASKASVRELMQNFWYAVQCAKLCQQDEKLTKDAVFVNNPWLQEELRRFVQKDDKSLGCESPTQWRGRYVNDDRVRAAALALEGVRRYTIPAEDAPLEKARSLADIPTEDLKGAVLFKYMLEQNRQQDIVHRFLPQHVVDSIKQQEQDKEAQRQAEAQRFLRYF